MKKYILMLSLFFLTSCVVFLPEKKAEDIDFFKELDKNPQNLTKIKEYDKERELISNKVYKTGISYKEYMNKIYNIASLSERKLDKDTIVHYVDIFSLAYGAYGSYGDYPFKEGDIYDLLYTQNFTVFQNIKNGLLIRNNLNNKIWFLETNKKIANGSAIETGQMIVVYKGLFDYPTRFANNTVPWFLDVESIVPNDVYDDLLTMVAYNPENSFNVRIYPYLYIKGGDVFPLLNAFNNPIKETTISFSAYSSYLETKESN